MPRQRDPRPSVKDERQYERLREQGVGKEKAARIANTPRKTTGKRGGRSPKYEDRTKGDLYAQARKVGIKGRSDMSKSQLIKALRNR